MQNRQTFSDFQQRVRDKAIAYVFSETTQEYLREMYDDNCDFQYAIIEIISGALTQAKLEG